LHGWRFFLWLAAKRSNLILAVSEQTKRDLHRFYKLPDSAVRVASLGVEPEFYAVAERRSPEPFILCVSTLHPHKNLERLIRAFAIVHSNRPEYKLVLVGMRGFHTDVIESVIAELDLTEVVQITGWIEREELYDLYRRAAAFVYPSTFEGFGIPVVEAMAAGVPLACSDIEPLRSNAGDAALLFPPNSSYDIADKILRLIMDEDLRRCLVQKGLARVREFSWEHTAECTLEALRDVVNAKDLRA
jgi:glycosyltransferase involved in cell wall biosynthesis